MLTGKNLNGNKQQDNKLYYLDIKWLNMYLFKTLRFQRIIICALLLLVCLSIITYLKLFTVSKAQLSHTISRNNNITLDQLLSNNISDEKSLQLLKIFEIFNLGLKNEMNIIHKNWKLPLFYYENLESYKDVASVMFPIIHDAGQDGKAFNITLCEEEEKIKKELFKKEGFNIFASDRVSFERTIPDARPVACQNLTYDDNLPKASIIIIFQNEALSLLLRTIHTMIKYVPSHLIHEVFLVDDNSDREEIKTNLSKYIYDHFPDKVKIIRLQERGGIMRARIVGALLATGEALVFLDSHCEANINWLVPLLSRIKLNYQTIAVPVVDTIDSDTLEFLNAAPYIGGFTWHLHYLYRYIPKHIERRRSGEHDIINTPTMSGGLFAISRKWFWELGAFDPGMEFWGAENIEMSFKTWMCGGSMQLVPCSHLSHMSRWRHVYTTPNYDYFGVNAARVAEVWMDSYKQYFYLFKPKIKKSDVGDISERIDLRQRLKCKTFMWYLDNVYPDKFLFTHNVQAWGYIRNGALCVDVYQNFIQQSTYTIGIWPCSESGDQIFSYTVSNEIRREESCLHLNPENNDYYIEVSLCESDDSNQRWIHKQNGTVQHELSGLCMDLENIIPGGKLVVQNCTTNKPTQQWRFEHYPNM